MRLSKTPAPSPIAVPLQGAPSNGQPALADVLETRYGSHGNNGNNGSTESAPPTAQDIADLLDLVANQRRDLLMPLVAALKDSEPTRQPAKRLMDLINDCGLNDASNPCAAAMAIEADLDRLASAAHQWTHPAQIVKNPDAEALYKLCAARLERESGDARERLAEIRPLLERTAKLVQKAASRRNQTAARQSKWVDQWL